MRVCVRMCVSIVLCVHICMCMSMYLYTYEYKEREWNEQRAGVIKCFMWLCDFLCLRTVSCACMVIEEIQKLDLLNRLRKEVN